MCIKGKILSVKMGDNQVIYAWFCRLLQRLNIKFGYIILSHPGDRTVLPFTGASFKGLGGLTIFVKLNIDRVVLACDNM